MIYCFLFQKVDFSGIPLDVFHYHLGKAKTANDVLKVFFDDPTLTEDDINSIMKIKQHGPLEEYTRHDEYMSDGFHADEDSKWSTLPL